MNLDDVTKEIHEVLIMTIPDEWLTFPDEVLKGVAWWEMMGSLTQRRAAGVFYPVTPARNVEIVLARSAQEVRAIDLRHPCADCVGGTMTAIERLESGEVKCAAVVQVTFDQVLVEADGG